MCELAKYFTIHHQYMTCVENKDAAITLANEVCSDDILASLPHPCDWSKESVIDYILTEETMKTAVDGRYVVSEYTHCHWFI